MNTKSSGTLSQKLLFYGVGAGAIALAAPAHATIYETDLNPALTGDTISFDPVAGTSDNNTDLTFTLQTFTFEATKAGVTATTNNGIAVDSSGNALELSAGTFLDGSSTFNTGSAENMYYSTGSGSVENWQPGDNGYLGLQLNVNGQTDYGWAHVLFYGPSTTEIASAVNPKAAPTDGFELIAFAYEDSGAGITVGVPEPASTTALLVAGAAGVVVWRRRRAAQVPA